MKTKKRKWTNMMDGLNRVLVVDDEVDDCLLVTRHLTQLGFDPVYALSMREALEKLTQAVFDIVFVDLNLKDGSGYDLIEAMKLSDKKSKVVVCSAYEGERAKAWACGAHDFLPKPLTQKAISETLLRLDLLNKFK